MIDSASQGFKSALIAQPRRRGEGKYSWAVSWSSKPNQRNQSSPIMPPICQCHHRNLRKAAQQHRRHTIHPLTALTSPHSPTSLRMRMRVTSIAEILRPRLWHTLAGPEAPSHPLKAGSCDGVTTEETLLWQILINLVEQPQSQGQFLRICHRIRSAGQGIVPCCWQWAECLG